MSKVSASFIQNSRRGRLPTAAAGACEDGITGAGRGPVPNSPAEGKSSLYVRSHACDNGYMEPARFYKPSGRFGLSGVVLALLCGAVASLAGLAHGMVMVGTAILAQGSTPFIGVLEFAVSLGLGAALGWATGGGAKAGKVRSSLIAGTVGALFGTVALYQSWLVYLSALLGRSVSSPSEIVGMAAGMIADGKLSAGGVIADTLVVLAASTGLAAGAVSRSVFCERCGRWAKKKELPRMLPIGDVRGFVGGIKSGDLSLLGELAPAPPDSREFALLEVQYCPGCRDLYALTIRTAWQPKRQRRVDRKPIVGMLLIDVQTFAMLQSLDPNGQDG